MSFLHVLFAWFAWGFAPRLPFLQFLLLDGSKFPCCLARSLANQPALLPHTTPRRDGVLQASGDGVFHSGGRVGFDTACTPANFSASDSEVAGQAPNQHHPHCEIWARRLSDGDVAVVM